MDSIEEIKTKLDIIDVIREYIPLAQAGANFRARCPFHEEKTPSFMVSRSKQLWYCFGGCNEGGDMFKFVMKQEGLEFGEALRYLAAKAGVQLERQDPRQQGQKTRLLDLMHLAAQYYQQALARAPQAEHARQYLANRLIDPSIIDDFCLGAALPDASALSAFLLSKKYTAQEIMQAGLALQKDHGYGLLDRFRNRIMIPIRTMRGDVIGFGGRTLEADARSAKYLNSPQTPLYDKSAVVYNLDMAKQEIRTNDSAIIVEGYMDVFSVWASGMKHVVASSGTALTVEQIRLIGRFTKHLLFSFDMDPAGIAATQRGIELALREGMDVKVIVLPNNADGSRKHKDPDECIRHDVAAWRESVANSQPFIQFRMDTVLTQKAYDDAFEKKNAVRQLLGSIALLSDRIEQDHWVRALAERVGISGSLLWEELVGMRQKTRAPYSTVVAQPATPTTRMREEILMAALLKSPNLLFVIVPLIQETMLSVNEHQELYRILAPLPDSVRETPDMIGEMARVACTGEYVDRLLLLADKEWAETTEKEFFASVETLARTMRAEYIRNEITRLQARMREAEQHKDADAMALYTRQFHDLQNM
ncbi:DNA primase [Candidatus Uhrbacteria bacterium]|nr:DNA primase [Candidatus Uhrbacteria bacterium]